MRVYATLRQYMYSIVFRIRALFRLFLSRVTPYLGLTLRILFCYGTGAVILAATSQSHFDSRFAIRGQQKVNSDITIISVTREDIISASEYLDHTSKNILRSLKEIGDINDAFYWNISIWEKALALLSSQKAKTIVVTLYGGKDIPSSLTKLKNVFWATKEEESISSQTGALDLFPDPDGNVRHFFGGSSSLAFRAAGDYLGQNPSKPHYGQPINFQGPRETFTTFSFSDLLKGKINPDFIKNKIIIITAQEMLHYQLPTPVGLLSTGEALANVTYNFIHDKWVTVLPFIFGLIYLAIILAFTLWIIFKYPESVALVFLSFLAISALVASAALFDLYAFWIPVEAPLALIVFTYVVITGYRLGESEKYSWQSAQELLYISKVESLKNNFLSLISHDLKNPLAKIQGITDRLLSSKEPPLDMTTKEDLNTIRRTSDELRQYITSILQLSRVEAQDIKLNKEVCDINIIAKDVLERLKPLSDSKKITIETKLEPLFSMELDRTLISEVLINLVENAIKYSESGSVIEVKTSEEDNQIKVEVIDQAGGITEEELPNVFDKFYRGKSDKTIKVTGSGLGLYLVKYFIELHGGKVFISSHTGEGTRIGFTLPLQSEEDQYAAEFARSHRG